MAWGMKLSLSLVVRAQMLQYHRPDSSRQNSLWMRSLHGFVPVTPEAEATLNRRAALIISPVDPVDRCTALCQSHRRLKHRAAPRLPRDASASGVTGTKF
ncbi:unnamed protein product [Pleuronectes platessa]|uniref:Uncharacterized protein n=1 Tax=Pleuronectes platessa TaxID=8262 RepID=A0A9N7TRM3_PLEPL|nr:unnamed protein product [Pleuronectes platessa]